MKNLIARADALAAWAHVGQKRLYTGEPYITHPRAVAAILKAHGASDELIAAGLLHDVIEDTGVTYAQLKVAFGETVADLVQEVSNPPGATTESNNARLAAASPDAQTLKLADIIHNTSNIVVAAAANLKWAQTYLKDKGNLLLVMDKGNPTLYRKAWRQLIGDKS